MHKDRKKIKMIFLFLFKNRFSKERKYRYISLQQYFINYIFFLHKVDRKSHSIDQRNPPSSWDSEEQAANLAGDGNSTCQVQLLHTLLDLKRGCFLHNALRFPHHCCARIRRLFQSDELWFCWYWLILWSQRSFSNFCDKNLSFPVSYYVRKKRQSSPEDVISIMRNIVIFFFKKCCKIPAAVGSRNVVGPKWW